MNGTKWDHIKYFINSKPTESEFTSKELRDIIVPDTNSWYNRGNVSYLPILIRCKFITRVRRGVYKILTHIPEHLNTGDLFCLTRGDNLSYIERLQDRKDQKAVDDLHAKHITQFSQEREKVIVNLMEEVSKLIANSFSYLKYGINTTRLTQQFNELQKTLKKHPKKVTDIWLNSTSNAKNAEGEKIQ